MTDISDWNSGIIEEFRANEGKVGGPFEGATMLLLHSTGARSGVERVNPLVYQPLGPGRVAVFASKGGAPDNPDWYYNLLTHPEVSVEIGTESHRARARVADDGERALIWERQKAERPSFAEYERSTTRTIPVVILEEL